MSDTQTPLPDLGSASWPPLKRPPGEVRARAAHRRARRAGLAAALAVGVLGTGVAYLPQSSDLVQQANKPQQVDGKWHAHGATMVLPNRWTMASAPATPGRYNACLEPAASPGSCGLLLTVVEDPDTAQSTGISPAEEVTASCRDNSPMLTHEQVTVDGRTGGLWRNECKSPAAQHLLWALDNRTVALRVQDDRHADEARAIFASLRVPASWPVQGIEYQSATAEPSPPGR